MSLFVKNFDCNRPKREDKKPFDKQKRSKDERRSFKKKRDHKVFVADESESKWADSGSESSETEDSSSESDDGQVQCLMADSEPEENNDDVFNFGSSEFK